jgi:hypothetical protein
VFLHLESTAAMMDPILLPLALALLDGGETLNHGFFVPIGPTVPEELLLGIQVIRPEGSISPYARA